MYIFHDDAVSDDRFFFSCPGFAFTSTDSWLVRGARVKLLSSVPPPRRRGAQLLQLVLELVVLGLKTSILIGEARRARGRRAFCAAALAAPAAGALCRQVLEALVELVVLDDARAVGVEPAQRTIGPQT